MSLWTGGKDGHDSNSLHLSRTTPCGGRSKAVQQPRQLNNCESFVLILSDTRVKYVTEHWMLSLHICMAVWNNCWGKPTNQENQDTSVWEESYLKGNSQESLSCCSTLTEGQMKREAGSITVTLFWGCHPSLKVTSEQGGPSTWAVLYKYLEPSAIERSSVGSKRPY